MIRTAPRNAAVYGVDLGKNIFHVVGLDERGAVVQRVRFRRDTLLTFFERAQRSIVGMEACPGAQWLARKLIAMGHQVRIVPAQFVKPYVKSQKKDTIDAKLLRRRSHARQCGSHTFEQPNRSICRHSIAYGTSWSAAAPGSSTRCTASVSNTALPSAK